MSTKISNIHLHIFNDKCAPSDVLKISLGRNMWPLAKQIKAALSTQFGFWLIGNFVKRYKRLIAIGKMKSQADVFLDVVNAWTWLSPETIFCPLTMNMDNMSDPENRPVASFEAQILEIAQVSKDHPNLKPFLGVDPRHDFKPDIHTWISQWFNIKPDGSVDTSVGFAGVKLYPALGFYPFDGRLAPIYAFCEEHQIPVMTHCTRTGSFYIGSQLISLVQNGLSNTLDDTSASVQGARQRWDSYLQKKGDYLLHDFATELFSHPRNYEVILTKYPKLKLCLAHGGGEDEVMDKIKNTPRYDGKSWYQHLKEMMASYKNLYTDISFTLAESDALQKMLDDMQSTNQDVLIKERVLFGTDYFVVASEGEDSNIVRNAKERMGQETFELLMANNLTYLP